MRCWGDWLRRGVDGPFTGDVAGEVGVNLVAIDLGTGLTPLQIVVGEGVTCVLFTNQRVKCWGNPAEFGTLGNGDRTPRAPLDASTMGDSLPFVDLGEGVRVKQIALKNLHVCALTTTGRIKCWGGNSWGQLGYGDTIHRGVSPAQMGDNLPYVDLGVQFSAVEVVCGAYHTCAILNTGDVKCWGNNEQGQLGYGDTAHRGDSPFEMGNNLPTVQLGTGTKALQLDAAGSVLCGIIGPDNSVTCLLQHTCAIVTGYQVKCWGSNDNGQLGLEDTVQRGDLPNSMGDNLPTVDLGFGEEIRELSIDTGYSCALSRLDGAVKCWGLNFRGALGQGDTFARGSTIGTMGLNLAPIDLGGGPQLVTTLETGIFFACAVMHGTYDVKCWGNNVRGNLGLGDTEHRGDTPGEMGDVLPFVDLGTGRTIFDGATTAPTQSPTSHPTLPTKFPTNSPTTRSPTTRSPTTAAPTPFPIPTHSPTTLAPTPTPDRTDLYVALASSISVLVVLACTFCSYWSRAR